MCYNPIIFQQWYDSDGRFHSHYYADYNPDIHTDEVLARLTRGLARVGMHRHSFRVIPCGKCKECRARLARDWKVRLFHHSLVEGDGIFVTLTYDDDHLEDNQLNYRHFQLFMKRIRRRFPGRQLSFFCAGEYGGRSLRRHFHCLIFGLGINDVKTRFLCRSRRAKDIKVWTSDLISECWDNRGFVSVSHVFSGDSRVFGYVSGYIISKSDETHVNLINSNGLVPEFHHMSLKPAIGRRYFEKHYKDIYRNDYVVFNSRRYSVPKAYDNWYKKKTERYVIREGVTGFGCLNILKNITNTCARMAYIFKLEDKFAFVVDKISELDIIKSRRKLKAFSFTCTDYNFSSRRFNLSKYLFNNRDLDFGGSYV
uniref:Replication initiator protein n=1 Tax=Dulem virus 89 TaxID=3145800 RepID=A0AAU8B4S1_9VIRU